MTIKQALEKANKQIQKKVDNALNTEVFDTIVSVETEMIVDTVYSKYRPIIYERRGEYEGLGDPYNIVIDGGKATGGVMKIINITEPNPEPYGQATVGKNLPELIEYGNGYKGYRYDFGRRRAPFVKPRPFTQATIDYLNEYKPHVYALGNSLSKQGLNVELRNLK